MSFYRNRRHSGQFWSYVLPRTSSGNSFPHVLLTLVGCGPWEAAVKSMKTHLRCIVADMKLTFEEFGTFLTQVEAYLNSRPLTLLPCDDCIEALTPEHFLIGRPLESLPDPSFSYHSVSLIRRWHCASLSCVTSGKGGQRNTSPLSDDFLNGITQRGMLKLETLWCCRKTISFS